MIVAIHQPNFLVWLPFFLKMAAADVFVLLRHCQYEKNGFQNRFFCAKKWRTMSVNQRLHEAIIDKAYLAPEDDWRKIRCGLPQYAAAMDTLVHHVGSSLAATNEAIIRDIAARLGISTRIEVDWPTEKHGDERLIEICQHFGADTYFSGSSGPRYMDMAKWRAAGIDVQVQRVEEGDKRDILDVL